MLIIRILLGGLVIAMSVGGTIYRKVLFERRRMMHRAAFDILKEDALIKALENPITHEKHEDTRYRLEDKIMIKLEKMNTKDELIYVMNPENKITFGRNPKTSNICLKDTSVSGSHCIIFSVGDKVWIKDVGSSNGTIIRRKDKNCRLKEEEAITLKNKDLLIIGETEFRICLFRVNKKYL